MTPKLVLWEVAWTGSFDDFCEVINATFGKELKSRVARASALGTLSSSRPCGSPQTADVKQLNVITLVTGRKAKTGFMHLPVD